MTTYKKSIIIENPQQLILSDLPFQPGQKVQITIADEKLDRAVLVEQFKNLLKETQSLPSSQVITEEEIETEIEEYRRGE